jgi:hypothetical protein
MSGAKRSPVGDRSPAHIRAGTAHTPAGGAAPYDPSDRQHDGKRLDALAELVRQLVDAPHCDESVDRPWMFAWPQLCAWKSIDGSYSLHLIMPRRVERSGTYFSTDALMDPTWDGIVKREYGTAEEAVRALLDNVIYRVQGPAVPDPTKAPERPARRAHVSADIGGDERF